MGGPGLVGDPVSRPEFKGPAGELATATGTWRRTASPAPTACSGPSDPPVASSFLSWPAENPRCLYPGSGSVSPRSQRTTVDVQRPAGRPAPPESGPAPHAAARARLVSRTCRLPLCLAPSPPCWPAWRGPPRPQGAAGPPRWRVPAARPAGLGTVHRRRGVCHRGGSECPLRRSSRRTRGRSRANARNRRRLR